MKFVFFAFIFTFISCQDPPPTHRQIFERYYQPYTFYKTFKSQDSALETPLNEGLQFYLSEDYPQAFDVFSRILEINFQKQITASFYSALCLMEMESNSPEQKEIVESLFLDLIRQNKNPFIRQSQWYLGLFYLQNADGEKGIPLFEMLAEKEGEFQIEAKEILNMIK